MGSEIPTSKILHSGNLDFLETKEVQFANLQKWVKTFGTVVGTGGKIGLYLTGASPVMILESPWGDTAIYGLYRYVPL